MDAYDLYLNREHQNERAADDGREIVSYLTAETAEQIADEIRELAAERDAANEIAAQYAAENERLRERVTNAETMLRSIREGWDRSSTGMTRLGLDLILGNPDIERRHAA